MVPAALAAKAMGRPVKLLLTRADDARFDSPRSPSTQRLRMAFDEHATGLGEPPTTVVGPAIANANANAIVAAVGARLPHLPMRPPALLSALNNNPPA